MGDFADILAQMMANPPDPNHPKPVSNRDETMYGATMPFQILSLVTVAFRLHARFRVVREPGWDDYFVIMASIFNLAALICYYGAIPHGLGEHLILLDPKELRSVMQWLYVQSACYYTTSALIKISLLCQYLRIFRAGFLRKTSGTLMVIVTLWGCAFVFMSWFPCFPVSGLWDRMQTPAPVCYGFGYGSPDGAIAAFVSFAATNMVLDTIIFLIPVTVYFKDGVERKQLIALLGLFLLGAVVVVMSVLRLWVTLKNNVPGPTRMDFTYWYPLTLTISCIEINLAIMCASMPIFWPVMVASMKQIFVTQEVRVTHHQRLGDNLATEYELNSRNSLKSHSSQEGLTRVGEQPKTDYSDPYIVDQVTGKLCGGVEVGVAPKKNKKKWGREV